MPIKFGSLSVTPPNIEKAFFGSNLVYEAYQLLHTFGSAPLTLLNAVKKPFSSLKQYGKCTQASTPTPSSPVDIKCNNGVIKVKHQSGLPVECALLESIESTGTQYIETGIHLDYGKDIRINGTVVNKTANKRKVIVGNYTATNTMSMSLEFAGLGQSGLASDGMRVYFGIKTSQALPATLYSKSTAALPLNTDIDFDFVYTAETRSFTLTCIANGQTYTLSDIIPNMFDGVSNETMTLFLDKRTDASAIQNPLTIKAMSITNDATAKEYVPVKKGNNVGMYDTVGDAFYANAGTSAFVGGSSVADPLTIYTVGTPEVLTVSASGAETQTVTDIPMLLSVGDYADEAEIISGLLTHKVGIKVLDGTEAYTKANSGDTVRFRLNNVSDLITGSGMGRIPAIYSHFQDLSSTSSQSLGGAFAFSGRVIYFIPTDQTLDLNGWKSWVAQQYAAGTPLIVIYPLAQETTEQATPQSLSTAQGTNTVSVTAEVSDIGLDIYYYGKQSS